MLWERVGARLTEKLSVWASSKDIICKLLGIATVSGGKGKAVEFFGPRIETSGATAMATVCNMSVDIGSTSCILPYSESMTRYLSATKRAVIASLANGYKDVSLTADQGSNKYYDDVIELDLTRLEPHVNGPFTSDLSRLLSRLKDAISKRNWPITVSHAMVGSRTNSS